METPVQIDFQGTDASPALRALIVQYLNDLESRFGRITAGRIAIKAPGRRHRSGGVMDINIHLALPNGREVKVSRTPQNDERYSNPAFAIGDAFKRARRQLQDNVRRMQGQVKSREEASIGAVTKIDSERGFGFLESSDGREIYFHGNSVVDGGFRRLKVGTRVFFSESVGEKGPQASTVKLLGKHGMR